MLKKVHFVVYSHELNRDIAVVFMFMMPLGKTETVILNLLCPY